MVLVWVRWAEGSEFVSLSPKPLLFRRQKNTACFNFKNNNGPWLLQKATPQLGSTSRTSLSMVLRFRAPMPILGMEDLHVTRHRAKARGLIQALRLRKNATFSGIDAAGAHPAHIN